MKKKTGRQKINKKLYDGLSKREFDFVTEYVTNGGNGSQAAMKAYPDANYLTCRKYAMQLLNKPHIQEWITGKLSKDHDSAKNMIRNKVWEHAKDQDPRVALKALDLIAKIEQLTGGNVTVNVNEQKKEYDNLTYGSFNESQHHPTKENKVLEN